MNPHTWIPNTKENPAWAKFRFKLSMIVYHYHRGHQEKGRHKDEKRWIIPGKLSFGLLSVLKVSVDILRFVEKIKHLPNGKFKVHLSEVEYPPQVLKIKFILFMSLSLKSRSLMDHLVSLCCRRHAAGSVGGWCWERRLDSGGANPGRGARAAGLSASWA